MPIELQVLLSFTCGLNVSFVFIWIVREITKL